MPARYRPVSGPMAVASMRKVLPRFAASLRVPPWLFRAGKCNLSRTVIPTRDAKKAVRTVPLKKKKTLF
jgi:hypothetical protein